MDAFKAVAEVITKQPGFISMQLHRAIGDSPTYLNYVMWEPTEAVRAAFTDPEFLAKLPAYPSSVVASPHLFEKVAVPGICTA
ncbi:antibiotic biosynthesis monooxygenase family protein [Pectobacterium polaris]|uniref:antibiotic biosynthesis monooxygenase family protein n=1 Tax=Pectobacterium polaris TaxID=2042057 RepID=UPI002B24D900|nr:antibiotic biosynthesis monooxygenase family protein [Pectobacterium polaris]